MVESREQSSRQSAVSGAKPKPPLREFSSRMINPIRLLPALVSKATEYSFGSLVTDAKDFYLREFYLDANTQGNGNKKSYDPIKLLNPFRHVSGLIQATTIALIAGSDALFPPKKGHRASTSFPALILKSLTIGPLMALRTAIYPLSRAGDLASAISATVNANAPTSKQASPSAQEPPKQKVNSSTQFSIRTLLDSGQFRKLISEMHAKSDKKQSQKTNVTVTSPSHTASMKNESAVSVAAAQPITQPTAEPQTQEITTASRSFKR